MKQNEGSKMKRNKVKIKYCKGNNKKISKYIQKNNIFQL